MSDAGPLHYLVLVDAIDILPKLFEHIVIPDVVASELNRAATPPRVRMWLNAAPAWLERKPRSDLERAAEQRGAGERAAIALARALEAQMLLIDDRAGLAVARSHGLETTGTLGVLVRAAQLRLIDLETVLTRLRATNFRCRPELLDEILSKHRVAIQR